MSAHNYKQIYDALNIDLGALGVVMLDLEAIEVSIDESNLYYSPDPAKFWIQGDVTDRLHVTLLYGLLKPAAEWKDHIDLLLEDINIPSVVIDYVSFFDSPYEDEPYYCVVAHLKISDELKAANSQLQYLPHINTFPEFKAHATLFYIKKDKVVLDNLIKNLNNRLMRKELAVTSINYGKP